MIDLPRCYRCGESPCICVDDIWLIHGDSREVLPLMRSASVDLVMTDPPYGHNNQDGDLQSAFFTGSFKGFRRSVTVGQRPIANDGPEANELVRWFFGEAARLLRKHGCCCCCCGGGPDPQFARWSLWLDESIPFKQMVVWDKGPMGMGWHYRRSYETVLVAEKPGGGRWFGGSRIENIIRPGAYGIRKIISKKHQHPTAKPVALMAHFVRLHTEIGDFVLDPFAGAGPTGVACKQLGRKCLLVELDGHWCEIAAKRLSAPSLGIVVQEPLQRIKDKRFDLC